MNLFAARQRAFPQSRLNRTISIQKGNSYCRLKRSTKGPRFKVSSKSLGSSLVTSILICGRQFVLVRLSTLIVNKHKGRLLDRDKERERGENKEKEQEREGKS